MIIFCGIFALLWFIRKFLGFDLLSFQANRSDNFLSKR